MKEVIHRNSVSRILSISLAILLAFSTTLFGQEGDPDRGKQLFNSNCAACHKLDQRMTGPALAGVTKERDREWLHKWIKNNVALRKSGDPDAIAIFEEYNGAAMNTFPQLSEQDIDDILAYTENPPASAAAQTGGAGQAVAAEPSGIPNEVVLVALILVFGMLVIMLILVNKALRRIAEAKGIELPEDKEGRLPLWKAFVKNQFLVFVSVIVLLLVSAYFVYGYMMQVGVDQGYEPVQPIHFSHRIHAGDNEIDCKYCHSSARVSRTSGVPSLNVCMNCHKNIMEVAPETATAEHSKEFYDGEIQKLYEAVGWDVENQAYTGETKPVRWVKIHNLPDFVYFNHSQHVTVAGLACQECHGPIEEMEVVRQFSPLTMGWCVDCHRTTDVRMEGNEYYEKIHEELSKKYGVEKLTAAQMGALECGKCHY
ncbi:c-type cytochrome [Sinomicrobium soli]|uniref:c-type cytochrome n=1 Tax=Sinomicrobium sp. N-1-3-6 TaxID=2219864 RepID=UPI000DCB9911|nr:c-type cytochrome [Sinomicrobium sp. N-1-3-6]RAV28593.1 cytochrome C [Sinomicrobium sp. N-1-3-6]